MTTHSNGGIEQVAALRAQLYDAGFRPVAVYNPDVPGPSPGKRPFGEGWQINARLDPPLAAIEYPRADALNTGILCDGLRAIDLDIDNPTLAQRCRAIAIQMFGEAPIRSRRGSPRCLLVYRASAGQPHKQTISGRLGKIEVLGHGQQFVAFGRHHEGADLEWFPEPLGHEMLSSLPAISEEQVAGYLTACAPIIAAEAPKPPNGHDHTPGDPQADPLRIIAALARIPNTGPANWDWWNRVGMAVWRATGGSNAGFEAFNVWSARNAVYDIAEVRERWGHYSVSPPSVIGAGSVFHMANEASFAEVETAGISDPPDLPSDAGYWDSLREHAMSGPEWDRLAGQASGRSIPSSEEARARGGKLLWSITEPWDEAVIPLRPWIAKGYLMRRSLTVISGPGSAGKSSLMVGWACSLSLGCAFNRLQPSSEMRVVTYNVEDDADEQRRRFSAMLGHLGLLPATVSERLAILGPSHVGTLLHIARDGGLLVNTPVMDRLEEFVSDFKPDVLMLDPFVELHVAEENDNTAIRAVLARLRAMAIEHDMATVILHHARKGNGEPGDPDTLRGASSIIGAARVVLTLTVMSEREAEAFGLPAEKRRSFVRLDGAKNNYAPIEDAEWFERHEIRLKNGDPQGDGVAIVWPWHPPSLWTQFAPAAINHALDIIAAGYAPGVLFAPTRQGKFNDRWAGHVLVRTLGVTDEQAALMLGVWLNTGLIMRQNFQHPTRRKDVAGVVVRDEGRPTI